MSKRTAKVMQQVCIFLAILVAAFGCWALGIAMGQQGIFGF
ncbi:hypothetical protein LCGC14_0955030 [marine sediment metagenome]|uniref:Lipoprotein n=1 Tax=marine sediment metagenome TaxID=412755 RepID=A0A0F9P2A1_9ZZZZ